MKKVVVMECLAKSLRRRRTPIVPLEGDQGREKVGKRSLYWAGAKAWGGDLREDTSTDIRGTVLATIGA